jgi:hypothetical protein
MNHQDDDWVAVARVLENAEAQVDAARVEPQPAHDEVSQCVRDTLLNALAADPKTDEPFNALVVWTELGRALSGTLDEIGAGLGYVKKLASSWFEEQRAVPKVDLARWLYRLDDDRRLRPDEVQRALSRVERALAEALPELARASDESPEGRRALFLAVVKGWFPVGLDLVRALPRGQVADRAETLGALWSWCLRYLPDDRPDGPGALLGPDSPPST